MAFYTLCPGCLSGDHTQHVEHWSLDVSKAIDKAEQAKWEREAISARARGDYAAERHALDMLALAEREIVGPSPFAARKPNGWGKRPEGVIDADICLCSGDCSERAATVAQTLRHMFLGLYSDTQVAGRVDPETTEWDKPRFYPAPPPPVVEPIDLPVAVALSVLEALPERVRRRRAELRLSYRQAAEAAGLDYNTVWRIEHGANMSLRAAIALLRWLAQPIP